MQGIRAVQVVLGEGEPGVLRLILEAQGFQVIGHARDEEELRRIVGVTRPTVIVLDAGISALALLDTQIRSDYVPIVVVWPEGAYSPAAEERVEPAVAFLELGNAVRRVVERHAEPIRVPDADEEPVHEEPPVATEKAPLAPFASRVGGKARHALVLAAAWMIALTSLAAIGLAVPSAFRSLEPAASPHALRDRSQRGLTADRESPRAAEADVDPEPRCAGRDEARIGPDPSRGESRGQGCALGHGKNGAPGTRGDGKGHGRPDDPGQGSGHGGPNGDGPSKKPPKDKDDTKAGGRPSNDPGPYGGGGPDDGDDPPNEDEHGGSGGGKGSDADVAASPQGKGSGKA